MGMVCKEGCKEVCKEHTSLLPELTLHQYDDIFEPRCNIGGVIFFRGRVNGKRPQEQAHAHAEEKGHTFFCAYNSFQNDKDSYSFMSFQDYNAYKKFFDEHVSMHPHLCRFFEQIHGPCRLYIDVDAPYPLPYSADDLINEIKKCVSRVYKRVFGIEVAKNNWRIMDSSKPGTKLSYHMVLHGVGYFKNAHTHMCSFFNIINKDFNDNVSPIFLENGSPLDKGVYTINRNFRLLDNCKHKNIDRPLKRMHGEHFDDWEYAATCIQNEFELAEDVVYEHAGGVVSSRTQSNRDLSLMAADTNSNHERNNQWVRGSNDALTLDELDITDIESMTHGVGPAFRNIRIVNRFSCNHLRDGSASSKTFTSGYSFDYDRSVMCFLCGGTHDHNHAYVIYDEHFNRYLKHHSTNCADRAVFIPYTPHGLCAWQMHFERRVWKQCSKNQAQSCLDLITSTIGSADTYNMSNVGMFQMKGGFILARYGKGKGLRPLQTQQDMQHKSIPSEAAYCNIKAYPAELGISEYFIILVENAYPPYLLKSSPTPWNFDSHKLISIIRNDLFTRASVDF